MISKALDECDDMKLYVAMNLAFAYSMRYGEICGLTWDKVHISDEDIANDDSYLWIEQELARVSREARQHLDDKDILFIFPSVMSNTHTNLVLTLPNGRPVENRIMEKEFSKLREKAGLPYVVFHSLRHSSTEDGNPDLTNLISALEQSPELIAMLTKALKGNAISRLLATALKVQFCVRFPVSNMGDNKYPKNRVL